MWRNMHRKMCIKYKTKNLLFFKGRNIKSLRSSLQVGLKTTHSNFLTLTSILHCIRIHDTVSFKETLISFTEFLNNRLNFETNL